MSKLLPEPLEPRARRTRRIVEVFIWGATAFILVAGLWHNQLPGLFVAG